MSAGEGSLERAREAQSRVSWARRFYRSTRRDMGARLAGDAFGRAVLLESYGRMLALSFAEPEGDEDGGA